MKKSLLLLVAIAIFLASCEKPWQSLFNGENLDGWDTWIGPLTDSTEALGLNNDTINLFTVVDLDGQKVIRIGGQVNASLATTQEFENYHLFVEFKWGDEVFTRFNSGLLYHSYGDFGVGLGVWMSSHELQLWTEHLGDSYRMGKSYCEIPVVKGEDGKYTYSKEGQLTPSVPDTDTKIVAKSTDAEKPMGEWNTVDLYCFGRTSVHVVNGVVNMINQNSGKYLGDGNIEPLTKGKIQFQSEGGEMFIRSIKIKPITKIPAELLK